MESAVRLPLFSLPMMEVRMTYRRYSKRSTAKNYFLLPNEIFSLGLTAGEIAVYAYLLYIEDRKTYQCRASYTTIGCAIHRGKKTVMGYVDGLVEKRLVSVDSTLVYPMDGKARNGSLLYTIRPIQEAIDYKNECQFSRLDAAREKHRAQKKLSKRRS